MKGLIEQNANFLKNETAERKKEGFIDTKAVGKQPSFMLEISRRLFMETIPKDSAAGPM